MEQYDRKKLEAGRSSASAHDDGFDRTREGCRHPPVSHLRLLVTVSFGPDGHDATLERVVVADDTSLFPDVPAYGRAMAAETDRPGLTDWEHYRARKRLVQCLLMDQYETPNGDKAIAIALHRHWTPQLTAAFGRPDDPSSIRRWRRTRGRSGSRRLADMLPSASRRRAGPVTERVPLRRRARSRA